MKKIVSWLVLFAGLGLAADLRQEVLYTQVRVRTSEAGGSGTVIYSEKVGNFYSTYIITCHHVVESAIKLDKRWDGLLQKERQIELRQPVFVEFFNYSAVPHGKPPLTSGANAEIVAYDAKHDMALLKVDLQQRPTVAKMLPGKRVTEVVSGSPVAAVGCALLHDPILTEGIVTHQGDVIDYADYWMSNAQIIFGNSGGGMFYKAPDGYFFLGIPSRIAISGWSTPITHLGYFSPINRVYTFFEEQVFDFLTPGSDKTEAQCEKERKDKREFEEKKLRAQ